MGEGALQPQVEALEARVAALERELAALREAKAQPVPSPVLAASSVPPVGTKEAAGPLRQEPQSSSRGASLENRIGSQIFNRVGIFAVLAAVAWFLKLAIDRGWIGPWPRVLLGLAIAAGLVLWSGRFRRAGFATFSHTLEALGTGIAYLALWAAFSVYHLVPAGLALLLMLALTAANSALAWWQDSLVLAAYALAGGLATPALLWTGGDHEVVLFAYLFLLDAAVVTLAALRRWEQLVPFAFAGTTIYFVVWWFAEFTRADALATAIFIALFFLLFALAPGFLLGAAPALAAPSPAAAGGSRGQLWLLYLPVGNGAVAFLEAERLLSATGEERFHGWAALLVALTFGGLLRLPRTGLRDRLWQVHAALAIGFLTLATPLGFHGSTIALLWLAEALLLVWIAVHRIVAVRTIAGRPEPVLRWSAFVLLLLAASYTAALPWLDPLREPVAVLLNAHFGTALAALLVFAGSVWMSRGREGRLLPATAMLAFNAVALLAVTVEIHHYWSCGGRAFVDLCGGAAAGDAHRDIYARATYSAWFMVYGAALMAAGFLRRSAFLRWQALVLLAFAIGKVFLFDASGLSSIYRVLSFLLLGSLLLAVSFAYQRNRLLLRSDREATQAGRVTERNP